MRHEEATDQRGYWVRSHVAESTELPWFSLSDAITEGSLPSLGDLEDAVQTEEVPASALAALAPRLPAAAPRTDELPRLDVPDPTYIDPPELPATPTSTGADRAAQVAAAIAADLDALDARPDEEATDLHAAMVDSEAPTGQFESYSFEADSESQGFDLWEEIDITDDPVPAAPTAPSLSVVREAPVDPVDEDYQDILATPLPLPPRPEAGAAWPPPARRPIVTEPLPTYPSDWLDESQVQTVVIDEQELFGPARPAPSRLWTMLRGVLAWTLGFFASFFTAGSICFTAALVTFALTL
jgi:hypothetical protein